MNGKQRREALSEQIMTARAAVTAAELAEKFGVSRQVIVQDIALLRAAGCPPHRNGSAGSVIYRTVKPTPSSTATAASSVRM